MNNRKVRWGVIGSGGIARRRTIPEGIIPAANAELAIVYDVNQSANKKIAEEFSVIPAESIDDVLSSDIDAVYLATPAYLHYQQAIMCAESGKNVLCEKPLALSVEEAEDMIRKCENAGVLLGIALMMRFQSQHQSALKLIKDGKLGKLTYGRAQLSCWYPPMKNAWRQNPRTGGGGSLMDLGSHCIDLLEMFFGQVKQVSCFINNIVHDYESEDGAVAMLFFENGAIATVDAFFCIPDASSKNILEIYGSKGSIIAEGTIGQAQQGTMRAFIEQENKNYDASQQRDIQTANIEITISPDSINTYRAEIEEFSQAILDNRKPANDGLIGLRNQKILAACYKSAKTKRIIDINNI